MYFWAAREARRRWLPRPSRAGLFARLHSSYCALSYIALRPRLWSRLTPGDVVLAAATGAVTALVFYLLLVALF